MPGGDLPKLHSETLRMLQQDGPQDGPQGNFPLRSEFGMVFVMLESTIFDFHERCWALHSLGGGSIVGRKTSNKQQVRESFWYHCRLEFVRSETNLTTTPLELWRA